MHDFFPLQLLLAIFAGWVNREQGQVVAYLVEENRVLKEQLRSRRLRLTDDQRRRLAAKGKPLGRRLLTRIATIVLPHPGRTEEARPPGRPLHYRQHAEGQRHPPGAGAPNVVAHVLEVAR